MGQIFVTYSEHSSDILRWPQKYEEIFEVQKKSSFKVSSSYHLCVECFSQLSFDSEVYTKSATATDFVYTSESNESCEKHLTER